MSLDDKFNPEGDELIDKIDYALFTLNKNIAKKYQDITHRNKSELETILYLGGTTLLTGYIVNAKGYLMSIIAVNSLLKGVIKEARPKNGLDEEIQTEKMGLPSKTVKYMNALAYSLGSIGTTIGAGYIVAGAITGNNQLYLDSLKHLTYGLGTLSYVSADYMAKSNIGSPPPKPKKKPVLERVKERIDGFISLPTPDPIHVTNYAITKN